MATVNPATSASATLSALDIHQARSCGNASAASQQRHSSPPTVVVLSASSQISTPVTAVPSNTLPIASVANSTLKKSGGVEYCLESSDSDVVASDAVQPGVQPDYVQYVESASEQDIYSSTNGQTSYPVYTVEEPEKMYAPVSEPYYNDSTAAVPYNQVAGSVGQGSGNNQLLAQQSSSYLIQESIESDTAHSLITPQHNNTQSINSDSGGVTYLISGNSGMESDGQDAHSHNTRATPATVHWLLDNYETAEGVSLPRSTLYNHYLYHCNERKQDPVNAASFGKLIRSIFLGLRTRRLGTRGNSKYHYYGIRIKPNSILNQLFEDGTSVAVRPQTGSQKRFKFLSGSGQKSTEYEQSSHHTSLGHCQELHKHHEFLGDSTSAIPDFPEIEMSNVVLPEECTLEDVDTLRSIYREHCEAFLDAILNLEFPTIESLWREFWRTQDDNNGDECEEERYLSKTKLFILCKLEPIQQFVRVVDYRFYQNLVYVLIPDVLRPIPSSLTQGIRNFAKSLGTWLTSAMAGCPSDIVQIKMAAANAFAQTLRRYTSLNHLAQAARAVLQNSSQINQMLVDLNRVDFHNVQDQASWVCECDNGVVQRLEADFKMTLQQQNSLEQWAAWLKGVATQVLKPYEGRPNFTKAARQFLLKWSFYSSMVIRDLTLRSAASFGSFHLIRLLYDEYMFFLIEHQVALQTGETPIAVLGEKLHSSSDISGYLQINALNVE
ncbi:DNA-binding protein RFX2 isoform X1 [Schistocerca americana]|uniref:DNA-binding protein RFX2 n=1 Tax=Schistocerca piceifrons TaxID=274613 RepID=UPI001F4FFEA6|nr:DNA-binding protein RFX2 isoform X1 [Schistocerca americana]XP_047113482.1 DNA-binding protein RFX2 [Schistocerca piceifrons]XP_049777631.1 DNA-binding protein RFX2 [Schistocerca cancellata]XP_049957453.1 DNA-binding protein RFX2 [Schistocerca serialis cubense]